MNGNDFSFRFYMFYVEKEMCYFCWLQGGPKGAESYMCSRQFWGNTLRISYTQKKTKKKSNVF